MGKCYVINSFRTVSHFFNFFTARFRIVGSFAANFCANRISGETWLNFRFFWSGTNFFFFLNFFILEFILLKKIGQQHVKIGVFISNWEGTTVFEPLKAKIFSKKPNLIGIYRCSEITLWRGCVISERQVAKLTFQNKNINTWKSIKSPQKIISFQSWP